MSRWNPFRELEDILQQYNRGAAPARTSATLDSGRELMTRADWLPAVDISESSRAYVIKAELPAVRREDVKLNVHDHVLVLSGERQMEKEEGDAAARYHRVERAYGRFARSFSLPEDADDTLVAAEYKDGVLSVTIPKVVREAPRSIDVKIA